MSTGIISTFMDFIAVMLLNIPFPMQIMKGAGAEPGDSNHPGIGSL